MDWKPPFVGRRIATSYPWLCIYPPFTSNLFAPFQCCGGLFLLLFALLLLVLLFGLLPARKPEKEHGGSVLSLAQGPLAPYMHLCMCMYIYIYIYTYIHTYIHTFYINIYTQIIHNIYTQTCLSILGRCLEDQYGNHTHMFFLDHEFPTPWPTRAGPKRAPLLLLLLGRAWPVRNDRVMR